jgi:hypothetical protein
MKPKKQGKKPAETDDGLVRAYRLVLEDITERLIPETGGERQAWWRQAVSFLSDVVDDIK